MVRLLHWLIRCYQIAISPLLGPLSLYSLLARNMRLKHSKHMGAVKGVWLSTKQFAVVILGVAQATIQYHIKQFVLFRFIK